MKYTGANSLNSDMDISPKLPEFRLPTDEDTVAANDSAADVDDHATPDIKSVEMPSSSSVSTDSSGGPDTLQTGPRKEDCIIGDDEDLLDLLVETLDVDFDLDILS